MRSGSAAASGFDCSRAAELYVSEKGTWTMLMTLSNGKSCIIAAGHSCDPTPALVPGTGI